MSRGTLEWYELLARGLVWLAGIVLLLSIIAAIAIGSSSTTVPILDDIQQQSQGIAAIAALGSGFTAAGLLAGVGAILRVMVLGRLAELGPETASAPNRDDRQERLPLDEPKRSEPRKPEPTETRRRERK